MIGKFNISSEGSSERGATLVEFTLASAFFIMLMGMIVDIGIGMHNYMLLDHATEDLTREIAVNLNSRNDCSAIRPLLYSKGNRYINDVLGADGRPVWSMRWRATQLGGASGLGGNYAVMEIEGQFPAQCYFLCSVFPNGIQIAASSEIVIERSDVDCTANMFET
jgi:hypothetical protein